MFGNKKKPKDPSDDEMKALDDAVSELTAKTTALLDESKHKSSSSKARSDHAKETEKPRLPLKKSVQKQSNQSKVIDIVHAPGSGIAVKQAKSKQDNEKPPVVALVKSPEKLDAPNAIAIKDELQSGSSLISRHANQPLPESEPASKANIDDAKQATSTQAEDEHAIKLPKRQLISDDDSQDGTTADVKDEADYAETVDDKQLSKEHDPEPRPKEDTYQQAGIAASKLTFEDHDEEEGLIEDETVQGEKDHEDIQIDDEDSLVEKDSTEESKDEKTPRAHDNEKRPEMLVNKNLDEEAAVVKPGDDKTEKSVFDTDEYHPQLHDWSKLSKKRSYSWVLLILLLPIAAALAYYIITQQPLPFEL